LFSADNRRLAFLLSPLVVPWTVLVYTGGYGFVFAWGLVSVGPLAVTTLPDYLFVLTDGLPNYLLSWPISVLLYGLSLASAGVGTLTDREDVRVTAGLLALAGVSHLWFSLGVGSRTGEVAVPVGTPLLWAVAWFVFRR